MSLVPAPLQVLVKPVVCTCTPTLFPVTIVPSEGERMTPFMFSAPGCIIMACPPLGVGLCCDEADDPPQAAMISGAESIEAINRYETCIGAPSRYADTAPLLEAHNTERPGLFRGQVRRRSARIAWPRIPVEAASKAASAASCWIAKPNVGYAWTVKARSDNVNPHSMARGTSLTGCRARRDPKGSPRA